MFADKHMIAERVVRGNFKKTEDRRLKAESESQRVRVSEYQSVKAEKRKRLASRQLSAVSLDEEDRG